MNSDCRRAKIPFTAWSTCGPPERPAPPWPSRPLALSTNSIRWKRKWTKLYADRGITGGRAKMKVAARGRRSGDRAHCVAATVIRAENR